MKLENVTITSDGTAARTVVETASGTVLPVAALTIKMDMNAPRTEQYLGLVVTELVTLMVGLKLTGAAEVRQQVICPHCGEIAVVPDLPE